MNIIVVDTSFFINLMIASEHKHKECVKFLKENEAELAAPEMLLIECASYFVRILKQTKEEVYANLEKIQDLVDIHGNYTKVEHVIDVICQYKPRGADSLYVRLADKNSCALVTCDKDQAQKYPKSIYI
jgi:predicted nucleic acid-binding protein